MALQALGKVTVAATGTPQRVTSTATRCQSISVQALSDNAGKVYIGNVDMDISTLDGVYAVLPAPTASIIPSASFSIPLAPAGLNAADMYIDVDNNDDGVLVTIAIQ